MDHMSRPADTGDQGTALAFAALLAGNVALAFGPYFVRLADTGPVAAGFWRLALATPVLFALAAAMRGQLTGMRPRLWWGLVASGVFFAIDLASWHIGIERTKLANATLFGNSGSIILVVYGLIIARVWPRAPEWAAVLLALAGSALLMGQSYEIAWENLVGDLFCLNAGIFYVGYLLAVRGARASLGSWSVLAWVSLAGALPILAIALALGEPVLPQDWTPVVILAFTSQIVGQGLMVYAILHFSPVVVGLALLTQPAIAALTGWLAFGETLSATDIAGMVAVGAALVLVRLPRRLRPVTEPLDYAPEEPADVRAEADRNPAR